MTMRDVRGYTAPEREPTRVDYRGRRPQMGPPSSGGSTDGEALNILEGFDLDASDRAQALHFFLEASRFSFADRNAYLADPDYFNVPLRGLLSEGFAAERRALIDPNHAAISPVPPGDPYPYNTGGEAAATAEQSETTTHLTVSDRWGNVVSYTYTIESTGGNGVVVPGWGFLLNNELTDFNFDSLTHPNRVEGGKRPRSSMPDNCPRRRSAVPGPRLSRRLDDHHDRAADPRRPAGSRRNLAGGDRRAAREPAEHRADRGGAGVHQLAKVKS